jgi:hypothetical protein
MVNDSVVRGDLADKDEEDDDGYTPHSDSGWCVYLALYPFLWLKMKVCICLSIWVNMWCIYDYISLWCIYGYISFILHQLPSMNVTSAFALCWFTCRLFNPYRTNSLRCHRILNLVWSLYIPYVGVSVTIPTPRVFGDQLYWSAIEKGKIHIVARKCKISSWLVKGTRKS